MQRIQLLLVDSSEARPMEKEMSCDVFVCFRLRFVLLCYMVESNGRQRIRKASCACWIAGVMCINAPVT
jgi:hypothetical protein